VYDSLFRVGSGYGSELLFWVVWFCPLVVWLWDETGVVSQRGLTSHLRYKKKKKVC